MEKLFNLFCSMCLLFSILLFGCEKNYDILKASEKQNVNFSALPDSAKILFIGSSYLQYPGSETLEMFIQMSSAGGHLPEIHQQIILGYGLRHHCKHQPSVNKMKERHWDYVLLQDAGKVISKKKWHSEILPYLEQIHDIVRDRNSDAKILYMMPWAFKDGLSWIPGESDDYFKMQKNIYTQSIMAANKIDLVIAPVGWAWHTAISDSFQQNLFLADLNHQSPFGAYLAASVFYSSLYHELAPFKSMATGTVAEREYLSNVAHQTVMNDLILWRMQ